MSRSAARQLKVLTITAGWVLVIHGDADKSAPIDLTGRRCAELLPSAELRVYEGAPHGPYLTHLERLNWDIVDFALR